MDSNLSCKFEKLKAQLLSYQSCAIAFSGGVDSTFLTAAAYDVLKEKCLAVIATSSTYPKREYNSAIEWLDSSNIAYIVIESEELDIPGFAANPRNRCYFCKKELFSKVRKAADEHGLLVIADGTNLDDLGDHRPGMQAGKELCVKSPLLECGFTKTDIRQLSKEVYNLPTADKQPMACMSSRFPYGFEITSQKLNQVEAIEDFLYKNKFSTFRARHHGETLRLELDDIGIKRVLDSQMRSEIVNRAKELGFVYVSLDLEGFRSGSMNESTEDNQAVV